MSEVGRLSILRSPSSAVALLRKMDRLLRRTGALRTPTFALSSYGGQAGGQVERGAAVFANATPCQGERKPAAFVGEYGAPRSLRDKEVKGTIAIQPSRAVSRQ